MTPGVKMVRDPSCIATLLTLTLRDMSQDKNFVRHATLMQKGKRSLLRRGLFRDRSLLDRILVVRRLGAGEGKTEARGECSPTLNMIKFPIGSLCGGEGSVKTYVTKTPILSRYKGCSFLGGASLHWVRVS